MKKIARIFVWGLVLCSAYVRAEDGSGHGGETASRKQCHVDPEATITSLKGYSISIRLTTPLKLEKGKGIYTISEKGFLPGYAIGKPNPKGFLVDKFAKNSPLCTIYTEPGSGWDIVYQSTNEMSSAKTKNKDPKTGQVYEGTHYSYGTDHTAAGARVIHHPTRTLLVGGAMTLFADEFRRVPGDKKSKQAIYRANFRGSPPSEIDVAGLKADYLKFADQQKFKVAKSSFPATYTSQRSLVDMYCGGDASGAEMKVKDLRRIWSKFADVEFTCPE